MDDFTESLVKKFNFKPKYIRRKKYMYICNTDKGTKVISPTEYTTDKILFVHNIKQHLLSKGFDNINSYYMSNENLPYVINENITYIMTDYIDLDECDLSKKEDTKKMIELMANFHKLCQGFKYEGEQNFTNSDIKMLFKKKLDNLVKMKKIASKQKKLTDFELTFIKSFDYFYRNAVNSINILEKYRYENLNTLAHKNSMICHNKIKEENILIGKKCYLTQLEHISINHFIYDLASFISRYIKKHCDDYFMLEDILSTYSKINYIDSSLLPIIYALVNFPTRYIDTCQSFFERRRNFTPICITTDLEETLMLKDFQQNYLSKISLN